MLFWDFLTLVQIIEHRNIFHDFPGEKKMETANRLYAPDELKKKTASEKKMYLPFVHHALRAVMPTT